MVVVGVRDRVGVRDPAVGMGVDMLVRVRVAAGQRVRDHQRRARRHHCQGEQVHPGQPLMQEHKGERRPDERRNGIVCAGFCGPEGLLRPYIQENAQAVGHEAQQQCQQDIPRLRHRLPRNNRDGQRAEAGEDALDRHDLVGVLCRNVPCAVVLKAPADRRQQHKQRAAGKAEAVRSLEREQDAGERDERDGAP